MSATPALEARALAGPVDGLADDPADVVDLADGLDGRPTGQAISATILQVISEAARPCGRPRRWSRGRSRRSDRAQGFRLQLTNQPTNRSLQEVRNSFRRWSRGY